FAFAFIADGASDTEDDLWASAGDDAAAAPPPAAGKHPAAPPRSTFSHPAYLQAAQRVLDYIAAGDVFQVNLSQRFTAPLMHSPRSIYQRLIERTPAEYGAMLDFGDFALLSNSPELFLEVRHAADGER